MPCNRDFSETDWNAAYSWGTRRHSGNAGDSQVENVNVVNLNFYFIKSLLINFKGLTDIWIKFMRLDVGQTQNRSPIVTVEFDMMRLIYGYCYPKTFQICLSWSYQSYNLVFCVMFYRFVDSTFLHLHINDSWWVQTMGEGGRASLYFELNAWLTFKLWEELILKAKARK